jgi:hypothetical protein
MAARVKERNHPNHFKLKHDGFGNYIEQNGLRTYSISRPLDVNTSTTYGGTKIPAGSLVRTSDQVGRDKIWVAGVTLMGAIGGTSPLLLDAQMGLGAIPGGKVYKAYFSQTGVEAPTIGRQLVNDVQPFDNIILTRTGVGDYNFYFDGFLNVGELFVEACHVVESAVAGFARLNIIDTANLRCEVFTPAGVPVDLEGELHLYFVVVPEEAPAGESSE